MIMSLWPIYMFIVVSDYLNVGLITTIATVIGTMLMLYVGRLSDKMGVRELIQKSSIFYGVTWILRFVAGDIGSVLVFDSLTKSGKDLVNVPLMKLTFDRAAENDKDWAIAYSVFYEFSLSIGKIITAIAGIAILSLGGSIFMVFAFVGVMTMLYGYLK